MHTEKQIDQLKKSCLAQSECVAAILIKAATYSLEQHQEIFAIVNEWEKVGPPPKDLLVGVSLNHPIYHDLKPFHDFSESPH